MQITEGQKVTLEADSSLDFLLQFWIGLLSKDLFHLRHVARRPQQ